MKIPCCAILLGFWLATTVSRAEDVIYVSRPLFEQAKNGQLKIETTKLDLGSPEAVFDGDPRSLARTPALNPAFVRVEFPQPLTVQYFRLYFSEDEHECTVAAADNARDLAGQTGSYRRLVEKMRLPRAAGDGQLIALPAPVTAKAFQLDVKRLTGDDYVHFFEWQFCKAVPPKALRVQYLAARALAHKPAEILDFPETLTRPVSSVIIFKASAAAAETEDGDLSPGPSPKSEQEKTVPRVDVTDAVKWEPETAGALLPFGNQAGHFYLRAVGTHRLTASYGSLRQTVTVEVTPREMRNRRDDLEVAYIERLPRLDYDGPNGGWPTPGNLVVWRGHIFNWGRRPVQIKYEWLLDGEVINRGARELPPLLFDEAVNAATRPSLEQFKCPYHDHSQAGLNFRPPSEETALYDIYSRYARTVVDLRWRWEPKRHRLALRVTPLEPLEETSAANNEAQIHTDALTAGFWVEESVWLHHHEHQHELSSRDANSFAGWGQRAMWAWNEMFAAAKFAETPQGIRDRVRLDRLIIVPDGALPLAGGLPSNNPDNRDKSVDLVWGFPAHDLASDWWSPEKAKKLLAENKRPDGAAFYIDFALFHELGHARYLVDTYGFDVHAGPDDLSKPRNVRVTDETGPILGRYMPAKGLLHKAKYAGQMSSDYTRYSAYEALMLNRVTGKRARGGNCNSPSVIGEYLQEIPAKLVYVFTDAEGQPLANADVWAYQARPDPQAWYGKIYADPPDVQTRADAQGRATFDRTLFARDGKIVHTFGHANSVVLLRVTHEGQHYYLFEEVSDCNMAYALGQREEAVFSRKVRLRAGEPSPAEWKSD